jgi:hypothetical protein
VTARKKASMLDTCCVKKDLKRLRRRSGIDKRDGVGDLREKRDEKRLLIKLFMRILN